MDFIIACSCPRRDGVMMTDTTGTIVDWNPAMERMTGWTRERGLWQRPVILKSGNMRRNFMSGCGNRSGPGIHLWNGSSIVVKTARSFWSGESVSPVKASDGTTQYFMAILTDLSELMNKCFGSPAPYRTSQTRRTIGRWDLA